MERTDRDMLRPVDPPTRLAVGLAAVGRPAYLTSGRDAALPDRSVHGMRRTTHAVLDAAYAEGLRHVDVARSYGRAEEFLAQWLDDRGHDDVVVSSKWGYAYVGGWRLDADVHERQEHSREMFTRQWQETRDVLGERVALYQVHSAKVDSGLFTDEGLLRVLADLRESGVAVGVTTSGPRQADTVRAALDVAVDGVQLFSGVQATWNLLEPSVGDALAEAAAGGWTVLVKEAVANGRLTAEGDAGAPGTPLAEAAARLGTTPDALALRVALDQPSAPRVLSGAATPEQLRSNVAALSLGDGAQDLDLADLDLDLADLDLTDLAEPAEDYWERRSQRAWA